MLQLLWSTRSEELSEELTLQTKEELELKLEI